MNDIYVQVGCANSPVVLRMICPDNDCINNPYTLVIRNAQLTAVM
jgi:hypothetical protein